MAKPPRPQVKEEAPLAQLLIKMAMEADSRNQDHETMTAASTEITSSLPYLSLSTPFTDIIDLTKATQPP